MRTSQFSAFFGHDVLTSVGCKIRWTCRPGTTGFPLVDAAMTQLWQVGGLVPKGEILEEMKRSEFGNHEIIHFSGSMIDSMLNFHVLVGIFVFLCWISLQGLKPLIGRLDAKLLATCGSSDAH